MKFISYSIIFLFVCLAFAGFNQVLSYEVEEIPDGRIVGGIRTSIYQFPHQISLRYRKEHRCGGSIISQKVILTAAHCVLNVNSDDLVVRAGTTFRNYPGTDVKVERTIIHEKYGDEGQDYDIAILVLADYLKYSSRIQAISLDEATGNINQWKTGSIAYVTGWGSTKEGGPSTGILNYATVYIVSQEICSKAYYPTKITECMLCAGLSAGRRDSCQGDSGGPLIVIENSSPKLIGIVSWGNGCGRSGYPGVYARISTFRSWISSHVNL